ncbi:HupE/UreJ family protein [Methylomonas koyamae]|uniref:HupE/UreJ family protein n=1 Tax=Methylomonas koyamae TaxID=702114 RepID=UPI000BC32F27|nr:HupE/UreJ family protein [Methylomonas koyamae]ATG88531.1 hypothetical protein MKLM6_0249 [Methylomonas koyamae]
MTLRRSRTRFELSPAWLRLLGFGLPLLAVAALFGARFFGLDTLGWNNGFNHPLAGWDHLLAMLAVGIWAAQLRGQAVWMLPLAFVGVMSLGGLAGAAGITIPSVEGIILLSCAVFALLVTRKIRFSSKINVLIVAFFAFFHGFAHGQEISTSASLISYTLGFMLATLLLHGAGILVAKLAVLAATFLLTAMFSQSVWAKAGPAETADVAHWSADAAFYSANPADYRGRGLDAAAALDSQACTSAVASHRANAAIVKAAAGVSGTFAHVVSAARSVLPAAAGYGAALADLAGNGLSGFKQRFPDINQTPGTQLLSSGVGRTSPPFAVSARLAPIFSAFRFIPALAAVAVQPLRAEYFRATLKPNLFTCAGPTPAASPAMVLPGSFIPPAAPIAGLPLATGPGRTLFQSRADDSADVALSLNHSLAGVFAANANASKLQTGIRPVLTTKTTATIFEL